MKLNVALMGRVDYTKALDIQERLLDLRQRNETGDTLLLLEHPPVITLGRRGAYTNILLSREELKAMGVGIHETGRGGDVTYHGPGQIVGYPIMDLRNYRRDVKGFVEKLEEVFIRLLRDEFNITARRDEKKYTGVWVGDEKITAIGMSVKRWVTMHGFAFNVNTELSHFQWINPCGITDRGVTSLEKLTGAPQELSRLNALVRDYFCRVFGAEYELVNIHELLK